MGNVGKIKHFFCELKRTMWVNLCIRLIAYCSSQLSHNMLYKEISSVLLMHSKLTHKQNE